MTSCNGLVISVDLVFLAMIRICVSKSVMDSEGGLCTAEDG